MTEEACVITPTAFYHSAVINYHSSTLGFIPLFITYLYIQEKWSFPSGINQKEGKTAPWMIKDGVCLPQRTARWGRLRAMQYSSLKHFPTSRLRSGQYSALSITGIIHHPSIFYLAHPGPGHGEAAAFPRRTPSTDHQAIASLIHRASLRSHVFTWQWHFGLWQCKRLKTGSAYISWRCKSGSLKSMGRIFAAKKVHSGMPFRTFLTHGIVCPIVWLA